MGRLEERIVESLTALRDGEPGCERHMLVFPVSLMAALVLPSDGRIRVVREGDALMICRPESP